MAVAAPSMEEPIAPAKEEPDKPEGVGLDQKQFNQDSREAMEKAFEAFNAAPETEPEVIEAGPIQDTTPAPQDADKPTVVVIPEPAPIETPAPRTSFKTLEEADWAYLESRKKMNEATESAAQLRKDLEAAQRRADEAVRLVMQTAQQGGERRGPAPAGEPRPA